MSSGWLTDWLAAAWLTGCSVAGGLLCWLACLLARSLAGSVVALIGQAAIKAFKMEGESCSSPGNYFFNCPPQNVFLYVFNHYTNSLKLTP